MDPITLGLSVVGLGMSLFGGAKSASNSVAYAGQVSSLSNSISSDEQNINLQKQKQMQLEGRRMQLEQVRNAQRQRSQATAAAVNQGANLGSGLQGGLGQIQGQSGSNMLGINQNMEIGQNIFGFNNSISGKRAQLNSLQAQYGADQAQAQGLQSLGGALIKAGPTVGAFGKDAMAGSGGGFGFGSMFMGGGSPTGYGR